MATVLGAAGMWLLLPRGARRRPPVGRAVGAGRLGRAGLRKSRRLGDWASDVVFYILAAVTVVAAAAAVTFRSPVYCAIWFALSLLGTAGLFLLAGCAVPGRGDGGGLCRRDPGHLFVRADVGPARGRRLLRSAELGHPLGRADRHGAGRHVDAGRGRRVSRRAERRRRRSPTSRPSSSSRRSWPRSTWPIWAASCSAAICLRSKSAGTLLLVALVGAVAILAEAARQMPPAAKSAQPRLDPRIVNSHELQGMAPPARSRRSRRAQEVPHG